MSIQSLSIPELRKHALTTDAEQLSNCLHDDLIITSNINYFDLFKFPCRLDAITMLICTEGSIKGKVNLKEYDLKPNEVFLGLPIDILQIESISNTNTYSVIISNSLIKEINIDIQKLMPLYLNIKYNSTTSITSHEMFILQHYYNLAMDVINSEDLNAREIIKGLLTALVYQIISYMNTNVNKSITEAAKKSNRNEHVFEKFMALLKEHHTQERHLLFYAKKIYLSSKHLSAVIKEVSGKSAAEWIDEFVVLEAKNLLKFSNMSIQQVGYYLNFSSPSAFGKYFKQQTGLSPKQFIEQ